MAVGKERGESWAVAVHDTLVIFVLKRNAVAFTERVGEVKLHGELALYGAVGGIV